MATYGDEQDPEGNQPRPTPLPKLQLFVVYLVQFTEPVAGTVIYPFVNELVRKTGITGGDETKTGYYAGIIQSTFFFSETCTVFAWGRLSDIFGRKPILLLGPLGLTFAMLGFGLSSSFWPLVWFRAFQGVFNGNIGVSKSVIGEITDSTNMGDAFALTALMWSSGATIGTTMGGVLSNPALQWPKTFGKFRFFHEYPYFLPCAAAGLIAFLSFVISAIAMKETLHPSKRFNFTKFWKRLAKRFRSDVDGSKTALLAAPNGETYGTVNLEHDASDSVEEETPPLSTLFDRPFLITMLNYGMFAFIDMSMTSLLPLVYSTPIEYGGLGMDPFKIGVILGVFGLFRGLVSTLFVGPIIRKYGPYKVFKVVTLPFFITYACFPLVSLLAKRTGKVDAYVVVAIIIQFGAMTLISPYYAAMSIIVVQNVPNKALLGSANGAAQMATSGSRAFAPAISSSLFAVSLQRNLAGGYAVYYIYLVLTGGLIWASRFLNGPRVST